MTYLAEALRAGVRGGEQVGIMVSLGGLARLAVAVGQPEVAARLIGGCRGAAERGVRQHLAGSSARAGAGRRRGAVDAWRGDVPRGGGAW